MFITIRVALRLDVEVISMLLYPISYKVHLMSWQNRLPVVRILLAPMKGQPMIRVSVDSIRVSLLTQHRVVVLREADSRHYIPIWIGPFEADAIAMAIQGHEPQRPLTHDLLKATILDLGGSVNHILISDIQDNTFFARIVVEQNGRTIEIDSRPSDAIALAVRVDVPIFVENHVLEQAGVVFDEDEQPSLELPTDDLAPASETATSDAPIEESDMSLFRDFINTLDLDTDKSDPERNQ